MEEYDLIGASAVADVIRESKMKYFSVHRYPNQQGGYPLVQNHSAKSSTESANEFVKWAKIVGRNDTNSIPYQVTIYDTIADAETESKGSRSKLRLSFILSGTANRTNNVINDNPHSGNFYSKTDFDQRIKELEEKLTLKARIKELEETVEELEEELDEVGENPHQSSIDKLISAAFNGKEKKKEPEKSAISGPAKTDVVASLNSSIKTLYKHDKIFHEHLAKLAQIAEDSPSKFAMMISMLDQY